MLKDIKMKKRFITLSVVGLLITTAILVGVGLANRGIKNHLQSKLVNDFSSEEVAIGKGVGASIFDRFNGIEAALTATAISPSIQSSNPAVCNPALQEYYGALKNWIGNLARVNDQGILYCSINHALLNKPASSLGTYVQTLFNDPQHKPVLSSEITVPNVKGYIVALHIPVYTGNHQFAGSIGGAVYLNQLSSDLISRVKFAKTGYVSVIDQNGDFIYSHITKHIGESFFSKQIQDQPGLNVKSLNKAILNASKYGKPQIVTFLGLKGVKKIASVQSVNIVPGHRWVILVSVPENEIANQYFSSGLNYAFKAVYIVIALALLGALGFIFVSTYWSYRLQKAKDQFISLVSHQLRTPLTSIRLFSEMLNDKAVGPLNDKQNEYIGNIHVSTVRMIELVGDILNVSRIGLHTLKINIEPTKISDLVQSEITEVEPLAEEKGIKITSEIEETKTKIDIDPTLYGQVVHNLLTNAVRYSAQNEGKIHVKLFKNKRNWELVVSDNGIGIPKNAQKHIFSQFYRASNAVQAVGEGTGLGLYLVKMIVTSTGGKVWFEDRKLGTGAVFHVTIPQSGMIIKKKN
jgi:signal transduction histidine kinase